MRILERQSVIIWGLAMALGGWTAEQAEPAKTVEMNVLPGLQFSEVRFAVKPGEKVRLVLNNTDDMNHNLLITRPGTRERVVEMAGKLGESGPAAGYVPNTADILWTIPLTAPGRSRTLIFNAPDEEGIYPYVCTYPGHGNVMFGAMYVSSSGEMPELSEDKHIPEIRRQHSMAERRDHPYTPVAPYHYRVFIDGASPAAIAVALPNDIAYCWDAGTCYLRFAWHGAFLDNTDLWKGKGNAESKVVGDIFFRSETGFPISVANKTPGEIVYKGYRMKNRYPEFHYQVDGIDIFELIHETPERTSLIRMFRIPEVSVPVEFRTSPGEGVVYSASAGVWKENVLHLSPQESRSFAITMMKADKK